MQLDTYIYFTCFDLRCVSAVSHQVIHSQEIRAESQSQAVVSSEVRDLQAELQDTLKALQQQQDPANIPDDDEVNKVTCSISFKKKQKKNSSQNNDDS